VLDILVQSHRDKEAAKKFFRKLLKGLRYVPRVIITDKLRSYHAAIADVLPGVEHPPAEIPKQSSRKFASANQTAGACDEEIQVSGSSAALSFGLRDHYLTLPSGATPVQS
jgi:hypothetical protein